MINNSLKAISKLEDDLWEAADQLRANSKLTSTEYCMPVLGLIFLRHATNRFNEATRQIQEEQAGGKMPKRSLIKADYLKRRALWLPENARYQHLLNLPSGTDLGQAIIESMNAIEVEFEPLQGVLPKEYAIFEPRVLEDLMRIFDSESIRSANGDLFGHIYEYFLMKFAMEGAQDKGEFFTPPSLVQAIVNVIEPERGLVFDPACGSGGMFVQTSHFIEHLGQDTTHRVTFYGQEKTATTIKLAKMNLAVHGLEGDIREANTFYEDVHTLAGKSDFVMANPPFNVDMVDAEKVKDDIRLPFGLPGSNKQKKVSNGNYLWIQYFYSYLNEKGRAGFVMSSQASSAGHGEKVVRRKLVETGHVDVVFAIRSNFFYTRSVPCELWFFDKGKPEPLRDKVLMIDARNVYRKVTRKIFDFSPEQLANLTAIVWLYRGRTDRYLGLVKGYFATMREECARIPAALACFEEKIHVIRELFYNFSQSVHNIEDLEAERKQPLSKAITELQDSIDACETDRKSTVNDVGRFYDGLVVNLTSTNDQQHTARKSFEVMAAGLKGLVKHIDLLYKLVTRLSDLSNELATDELVAELYERRNVNKLVKQLDEQRENAVEQLKLAIYFHRQIVWLQDRFPEARLVDVPGLVKLVDRSEIEAADWSLSPGRYVGVAPQEPDEDFDFEATLRDIHLELAGLNDEAVKLAETIQRNFEELGI